jgi:hypothetical protein
MKDTSRGQQIAVAALALLLARCSGDNHPAEDMAPVAGSSAAGNGGSEGANLAGNAGNSPSAASGAGSSAGATGGSSAGAPASAGSAGTSGGSGGQCSSGDSGATFQADCLACASDDCQRCACSNCTEQLKTCAETAGCPEIAACIRGSGCGGVDCYCGTFDALRCAGGQSDGPCKAVILAAPGAKEPTTMDLSAGPASDAAVAVGQCIELEPACTRACQLAMATDD